MKPYLRMNLSRFYQAAWFIISPVMVSGCVANAPPNHTGVVYTPPVSNYQGVPVISSPPTVLTETQAGLSAAGPMTATNVQIQPAAPQTTPTIPAVVVASQPPVPQPEVVPVAPGPDYSWTPGYWSWNGGSWIWISGSWIIHPRHGAIWVGGHWVRYGRGRVWVGGHWG